MGVCVGVRGGRREAQVLTHLTATFAEVSERAGDRLFTAVSRQALIGCGQNSGGGHFKDTNCPTD